jgi:hypothetical protein
MKTVTGMSRQGVDGKFGSTEGACLFVAGVEGRTLGLVAQLMGGGVDVAVTTCFDNALGNLQDKSAAQVQ